MGTTTAHSKSALKIALLRMRGKKQGIRLAICRALILFFVFVCFARAGSAQDFAEFAKKLHSGSTEEKRDALLALGSLRSEEASRVAAAALHDKSPMVRATAASCVLFLPKSEVVAALTPLLSDKDEFVRGEAAYAIGDIGDPSAAASLIRSVTNDRSSAVRSAAAIALGKVGSPAAISSLISVLGSPPTEDTEMLRRAAARSIGQIAQILRSGKIAAVTPQNFLPERLQDVNSKPSSDLLEYFNTAVRTLIHVLDNSSEADDTRREAAFALGSIGDRSAEASLAKYVGSQDIYLAKIAKEALLKIGAME
jgi:HEAT repeat protein